MITGPDISSNNPHPIDFAKVKASGQTFVIVKATEGTESTGYTNPYYAGDVRAARAAGLIVGHYVWPHTADPAGQVRRALSVLDWELGDLPVALDYEDPENVPHGVLDEIRDGLHTAGLPTMTYTYPDYWARNGDPTCADCASDPLWYATYPSRSPGPDAAPPKPPAPWRAVTFWQTDGTRVTVPGIGGLNDMSRFIGTDQQFAALCGSPSPAPSLEEDVDMLLCQDPRSGGWWLLFANNTKRPVVGGSSLAAYKRVLKDVTGLTPAELDSYKAA